VADQAAELDPISFEAIDLNDDGVIDDDEYNLATSLLLDQTQARAVGEFDDADEDNDGVISKEEYEARTKKASTTPSKDKPPTEEKPLTPPPTVQPKVPRLGSGAKWGKAKASTASEGSQFMAVTTPLPCLYHATVTSSNPH
jgi:hypothetical protein